MSRALPMAGFGVTLYGRIWVTPEGCFVDQPPSVAEGGKGGSGPWMSDLQEAH